MDVSSAPPSERSHNGALRVEARLLGPFEVALAGRVVHIGSPKQRAILALLALQARRVVPSDALCDLLWDDDPPAAPSAILQSLISRVRRTLGAGFGGSVETGSRIVLSREPGWVLDVAPAAVDALRFQELTSRARLRSGRGEAAAAAEDLTAALGLWRGAALADVVDAGYLAAQATRLNEARLDAVEDLAEAELATGRSADALSRLERHVDTNPFRERAWGLLMTALYRLGRQAAALATFQQVRAVLGEELGLEPSPELAEVEQRILRHDPALAGPRVTPLDTTPPPSPERPRPTAGEFADYSVVVVEDHDFQRRTVVQLLRGLGVGTVKDAADGTEALRVLEGMPIPDVVICDIDMPGMDGVEFVTRVAEGNLACSVVIASGLESNVLRAVEAIGEGHGLHVLAALPKPLTARRLGEVLRQYTRLNRGGTDAPSGPVLSRDEVRDLLEGGGLRAQFDARIDLATGAFSSAEARARWHAPDGTPIAPSLLAPAMAYDDLLLGVVERLVAASTLLLDEVRRTGLDVTAPVRVVLDVSPLLSDATLADRLGEMVRSRGQEPRHFVCQLADAALARAPASTLSVLTRLRVKGFGLSMTYSGVGPSWTNQLGRLPLTELKLVRPLVSAATSEPKRFQVLEDAVAAARDAGLAVVADGCDAQADFDMLLALGCSEAQGKWVAQPMEATEMVAWAQTGPRPYESGIAW